MPRELRVKILYAVAILDQGNQDRKEEAIQKLKEAIRQLEQGQTSFDF